MSEPIKQPQNNNNQPSAPQAQPPQPKTSWPKNTLRNIVYVISLMGLVALLFWLVIPTNPPATLAQVTPVATATAGGWEVPITQTVVPTAISTPVVIPVIVTIYPTPTEAPTRTPTPTTPANPDGSATVGGYTFSPPHAVKIENLNDVVVQGWLSDDTVVDLSNQQVLAINVQTGKMTPLSPKFENDIYAFRLMKHNQVFLLENGHFWLTGLDKIATEPLPVAWGYMIVGPEGEEVWLYDDDNQEIRIIGKDQQVRSGDAEFIPVFTIPSKHNPDKIGRPLGFGANTNYVSGWTILKTPEYLRLVNLRTKEFKDVDMWPQKINFASWSPDGQKMALLVAGNGQSYQYVKAYIFELSTGKTQEIKTEFNYISNITWAPDSQNLLFSANTGVKVVSDRDEYDTATLFLVNINSPTIQPVPVLPQDSYLNSEARLSWSPQGGAIVFSGYIPNNVSVLHRIDVTKSGN